MEIILGIIASTIVCWFSRQREFRADAASAKLHNPQSMINALLKLDEISTGKLPKNIAAMGISGGSFIRFFSTHPSISKRIEYLKNYK